MATAPSFQKYPTFGDPYEKNGRMYIVIVYPDGHHREVRWYDEETAAGPSKASLGKKIRSTKEVLGFSKGYITIFKGDTYSLLEWFRAEPKCRYHNLFGWYVVSEEELPENIPAGIEPVQLKWEDVAFVDEDTLKSETAVKEVIENLIYDETLSEYQGEVGDRLELKVLVTKAIDLPNGYYGSSTMYIMVDADENQYVWTTSTKKLEEGKNYTLRGTVKDHKTYKRIKQTILTRCALR